jgi:hypothetical protein
MTVGDVVRSGMRGAVTGYGLGSQVGAAAEAVAGMPRVQAYGRVAQMRNAQNAGLPRDAPGPRTAQFYAYRMGAASGRGVGGDTGGTRAQQDLMEVLHRDGERIRFARNRVRLGAYADLDPTMPPHGGGVGTIEQIRAHASTPAQSRGAISGFQRSQANVERNVRRYATNHDFANAALARL